MVEVPQVASMAMGSVGPGRANHPASALQSPRSNPAPLPRSNPAPTSTQQSCIESTQQTCTKSAKLLASDSPSTRTQDTSFAMESQATMQQLQARQIRPEAEERHNAIRNNDPSAILKLLEDRYLGKKRMLTRSCQSLLHYRYGQGNGHALAGVSIAEFTNFAYLLSRSHVLALTQDDDCFRKAREILKGAGIHASWSKHLGKWTKDHPKLARRFLEGMESISM